MLLKWLTVFPSRFFAFCYHRPNCGFLAHLPYKSVGNARLTYSFASRKFPGRFPDIFWTLSGIVRNFSGKNPVTFPGNVPKKFWKFPEISRKFSGQFPEFSRKFPGQFPEISDIFSGMIPEHAGKCPGIFPEISRKFPGSFPEISRKFPGIFQEISRTSPGNFPEISRSFPGNLRFWDSLSSAMTRRLAAPCHREEEKKKENS